MTSNSFQQLLIHLYSVRAIEMLSKSYIYLVHSSCLLLCHMGQYMGQYSPKYWEFQTKSLFSNCLSSFHYMYTLSNTSLHTHMLNHTVDIEI